MQLSFTDDHEISKRSTKRDYAEGEFLFQARAMGLPPLVRNYRFATSILHEETRKPRQWEIDFYSPDYRVGLEIEGIVFRRIGKQVVAGGRHAHPDGFREDCIKHAHAVNMGILLHRFECKQVVDGIAIKFFIDGLAARGWKGNS